MRIAFLTHEPFHPPSGGGSAEAIYLVREMVRRGHSVHLFCPEFADASTKAEEFGITSHLFKSWKMGRYAALRNFKYLLYPTFLQKMVIAADREHRFDLLFSQHSISAVAGGMAKRKLGRPLVMNLLDYLTAFMETWPPYIAPPPLLSVLKKYELGLPQRYQADAVLTVSEHLGELVRAAGYRGRIEPILYGYDHERFPARTAIPPQNPPVVVMHGSLDQHHLGQVAVEAVEHVSLKRPEVVFRFVGRKTPTLEKFARRVAERAPRARLEFTGFIPYEKIAEELAKAHCGMVPYEESSGTHAAFVAKIVEYLAVGLPVVSTRLKSISTHFASNPLARFTAFNGREFGQAILEQLEWSAVGVMDATRATNSNLRRQLCWDSISQHAVDIAEQTFKQGIRA